MDAPRTVLLLFVILFIFLSPESQQPTLSQQREVGRLIAEEHHALAVLNESRYGDLDAAESKWLNVTGLRAEDGYVWDALPRVQERAREQLWRVLRDEGFWRLDGHKDDRVRKTLEGEGKVAMPMNRSWTEEIWGDMLPIYQNVTGIVRGEWVKSPISVGMRAPKINLTAVVPELLYSTQEYNRNITGSGGKIQFKLDEKRSKELDSAPGSVREISAQVTIKDETSSGDGWEITMHGVHFQDFGGILLSTTSEKFAGLFALPQFALSEHTFSLSQKLLNETLSIAIRKQESDIFVSPTFPWSSSPHNPSESFFPTPHCEFIVYLQQHPTIFTASNRDFLSESPSTLRLIEDELRYPQGAPLPRAPKMTMSAVVFSPDCGFVLESKGPPTYTAQEGLHLAGPKLEPYISLAKRHVLAYAAMLVMQVFLLMRQMREASTPSTRSRVSFYAIAMMSMGDGFAFMAFLFASWLVDAAFLTLIMTAFFAFFGVSFFGMKFLMDIWIVQTPERRQREPQNVNANVQPTVPAQPTPIPAVVITPAGADTLPLPVTAPRRSDTGASPIIMPSDQDMNVTDDENTTTTQNATQNTQVNPRREFGALFARFYFLLLAIIFLSIHATSWPTTLRSIYANVLAFVYLSFWTPQIYRNVMRNCRKALRWEFVLGESLLRLAPFLYFYTVPSNVFFSETDWNGAYCLTVWVWVQVCLLSSQELFRPRFFVPNGWAPPAFDYHPILREDDLEGGANMPIGFTQASEDGGSASEKPVESETREERVYDCAICRENIDVPIVPAGASDGEGAGEFGGSLFGRRLYMVTPCRHIFHSVCLEGWMRFRLQCPICRETLPPL